MSYPSFLAVQFILTAFLVTGFANAGGSVSELETCIVALKKTPDNQALREKIIKMAVEQNYNPELPKDVVKKIGRGKQLIKDAGTKDDFRQAVKAFEEASLLAPWNGDIYLKLGLAQEKAGMYKSAARNLNYYLMATPKASNKNDVFEKIGGLELKSEKSESVSSAKDKKEKARAELKKKGLAALVGVWRQVLPEGLHQAQHFEIRLIDGDYKIYRVGDQRVWVGMNDLWVDNLKLKGNLINWNIPKDPNKVRFVSAEINNDFDEITYKYWTSDGGDTEMLMRKTKN